MTRALVLSGGGPVGIAWQTGLIAGLVAEGVVLADADFVVGTSAGSAVGAQLALGRDFAEQVERYRAASQDPPARAQDARTPETGAPMSERMETFMRILSEAFSGEQAPERARAAIGRFALEVEAGPEDDFVRNFRNLEGAAWPAQYACTAVDAVSGEFVVWNAENSAPLERAVASSCAVPGVFPPITIGARRYIDGGMRSASNADLAEGHDRVLAITLMHTAKLPSGGDPRMMRYVRALDDERRVLEESGGNVEVLPPDDEAAEVLGINLMDHSRGWEAANAGVEQGTRVAERIGKFWN